MIGSSRIWAIYRKELTEILRDRRTLIAMIVIPVVLYPLLVVAFVWSSDREESHIRAQTFLIEVDDARSQADLTRVIDRVTAEADDEDDVGDFKVRVGQTGLEALGDVVQLRVALPPLEEHLPKPHRLEVVVQYSEVNVHSRTAMTQFRSLLERFGESVTRQRLSIMLPASPFSTTDVDAILNPIVLTQESTATERQRGGWALGLVLPVILVLMTITGAVYPAIDLTAGERERGTLETLMASPVPAIHLVTGKFLVVATLSMLAATLNVVSMGATMHFSGLTRAMAQEMPVELPISALPIILLCMIPFALLFSAILIAVCSFARTYKEANNYVVPVIICAMVPAMAVTLPSVRLQGILLVVPVGNMVLLARDLFQQKADMLVPIVIVVLSTMLYAAAAIALAARLFGQEAVLFADAGSYRTLLQRRFFRPALRPTAAQALMLAALLFPLTFYVQSFLSEGTDGFVDTMKWLVGVQFIGMFVLLPLGVAAFLKIDILETFRWRRPPALAWLAAGLMGISSWALAHEFLLFQTQVLKPSSAMAEFAEKIQSELAMSPLWLVLFLMALVPAVTEEFLFRGFILSGLRSGMKKWSAIVLVSLIFGIYHFMIDRLPITVLLGMVLAYLCWQSGSLWPGIVFHAMHNGISMVLATSPEWVERIGLETSQDAQGHLPTAVWLPAILIFALGTILVPRRRPNGATAPARLT